MDKLSEYKDYIVSEFNKGKNPNQISKELNCACISILRRIREWIPSERNKNRRIKYDVDLNFFDIINTEEKAYVLGLFYSDGCVYKHGIRLSMSDQQIVEDIKKVMKFTGPITEKMRPHLTKPTYILDIGRSQLRDSLISKGCNIRKSLTIKFPDSNTVPTKLLRHFIRGYHDGDGSIFINKKGGWRASLIGTKEMMEGILSLSDINGRLLKDNPRNTKNTWFIHFERQLDVLNYLEFIYQDASIYLDRKYILAMKCIEVLKEKINVN